MVAAVWLTATAILATPSILHAGPALTTAIRLVERNYLFADELEPYRLLGEALEYTESAIPELSARPAGKRGYLLTAGHCRLYLEPAPGQVLGSLLVPLERTAGLVDECTPARAEDDRPLDSILVAGVLAGLDPYSTVLDAKRRTEHRIQFKGQLAGIGARIGIRNERLMLVRVYREAPAFKAGLRDDDAVLRIDGMSATNIRVGDAVERIRGEPGTEVRLTIERQGESEPRVITVTRGIVRIPSVEARVLTSGVVYAEISHFSQTTPRDFRERVSELIANNAAVSGVIIDLRRNSGGSMLGSSAIGDLFLEEGLLISTAGRTGGPVSGLTARVEAGRNTPFATLPIAFLTSGRTASGSELLAASLRNHGRAILVGERTFGKGTVQKTYSLGPDSALKITVGRFLPNRRPIPGGGLTPDVEFRRYRLTNAGASVPTEPRSELPFWLRAPAGFEDKGHPATAIIEVVDPAEERTADTAGDEDEGPDPILALAESLLADYGSTSATAMLNAAASSLNRSAEAATAELSVALGKKDIDWTAEPAAPGGRGPRLEASFHLAGDRLLAGETNEITVRLTNKGDRALGRVRGVLESEAWILNGRGVLFGRIGPGQHREWSFEVEAPARLRPGRVEVGLVLTDAHGDIGELGPFYLALAAAPRPHLSHRVAVDRNGEISTVTVEIENRGRGAADKVRAYLENPLTSDLELLDPAVELDRLAAGASSRQTFRVRTLASNIDRSAVRLVLTEATTFASFESSVALLPATGDFGPWREAPRLSLEALAGAGEPRLLASARDDSGLVSLVAIVNGDQQGYLSPDGDGNKQLSVLLPWAPEQGTKTIELVATDSDGLVSSYVADL
ncbi:MAG: S41 family peptidase [Deltaproteobacteria bacterium]